MSEEIVTKQEYEKHKSTCSSSFDDVNAQLAKLNSAMFGEKELERLGVYEMTTEMYKATMYAKGGQKLFLVLVKVAGGILTMWAAFELFFKNKS
jgi:hypothetical protein